MINLFSVCSNLIINPNPQKEVNYIEIKNKTIYQVEEILDLEIQEQMLTENGLPLYFTSILGEDAFKFISINSPNINIINYDDFKVMRYKSIFRKEKFHNKIIERNKN